MGELEPFKGKTRGIDYALHVVGLNLLTIVEGLGMWGANTQSSRVWKESYIHTSLSDIFSSLDACTPLDGSFKVKGATNEGNGNKQTGGQSSNQCKDGKATTRQTMAARFPGKATGVTGQGDDDDEDDKKRPPTTPGKKRLGCDRPSEGNKSPTKVSQETSNRSPSQKSQSGVKASWEQLGARPKEKAKGPQGDFGTASLSGQEEQFGPTVKCSEGDANLLNVGGSADNRPANQGSIAPQSHTSNKFGAIERALTDDGVSVPQEVDLKSCTRRRIQQELVRTGVFHGQTQDLIDVVDPIEQKKRLPLEELDGQEGVLLNSDLVVRNGCYLEGPDSQYIELKVLGCGSFGTVCLIQDNSSRKYFVTKCVSLDDFVRNEAVLWCDLDHPNIMPLLGLVRTNNKVLFLSEHHDCQSLEQVFGSPLGQRRALLLIKQLFKALAYLHKRRIVHKDIKPDNILLSMIRDHIWVIDFGLAMELSAGYNIDDYPLGPIAFLAPEIANCEPYDERVDVWCAICTLMYLLNGYAPWTKNCKGEFNLLDIPPSTHPRLKQFIKWALKEDFKKRPTAMQVLENWPDNIMDELEDVPAIAGQQFEPAVSVSIGMQDNGPQTSGTVGPPDNEYQPQEVWDSVQSEQSDDSSSTVHNHDQQVDVSAVDSPQTAEDLSISTTACPQDGVNSGPEVSTESRGAFVNIYEKGSNSIRIQLPPDFTICDVAYVVCEKITTLPFTLQLMGTAQATSADYTFGSGEHFLEAVAAPDGGDWLWRIDGSGTVSQNSDCGSVDA